MSGRFILGPLLGLIGALVVAVGLGRFSKGRRTTALIRTSGSSSSPTGAGGFELCSGVLVSPTVMVTAAHCFFEDVPVSVSFAEDSTHQHTFTTTGTVHNDPDFCLGCGNGLPGADTHDIAVVTPTSRSPRAGSRSCLRSGPRAP